MRPRSIRSTTAAGSRPSRIPSPPAKAGVQGRRQLLASWIPACAGMTIDGEKIMRLDGKIGIVTAAASGMGRAGALRFAKEGAAVGVADIDAARVNAVVQEITSSGGRALALVGDLRTDAFARDIVRRTA